MYKKIVLLTALFFIKTVCNAQFLEKNQWNYFDGKIGEDDIRLALYFEGYGTVKGSFCYRKDQTKIPFNGTINTNEVELKINGLSGFEGQLVTDNNGDKIAGKFSGRDFKLKLKDYGKGSFEKMYPVFKASDEEVEKYVKLAVKSILTDDKIWIMNNLSFPVSWWSNADWSMNNVDKERMKSFYPKIFTKEFKDKLKNGYLVNLSHGQFGVVVGSESHALLTVLYDTDQKTGKDRFVITSIDCTDEVKAESDL